MRFPFSGQLLLKLSLFLILFLCGITPAAKAATIVVLAGGDLQAAINAANCGDSITLQAGATFAGNFILRYKGPCTGTDSDYITIRTSQLDGITPPGTRITPAQASGMPTVLANSPYPALEAEPNAHHYKLVGINFTNVGGSIFTPELIMLGKRSSGGDIPFAQHPHHVVFDRDWIHEATNDTTTPDSAATTADRGMDINATDITVTECRIAGFRAYILGNGPGSAEASNAILFPYSALRVTVSNSYLEAWFSPVFFGGSGGETPNSATLTSPTFNTITNAGSAIFSTTQNLVVGDLVAFKTTGGTQPPGAVCSSCPCLVEIAKVTAISGNVVSYVAAGAKGDLTKGNPLRQVPDAPGEVTWNGYLNQDITIQRSQIVLNFNSTEWEWIHSGGDPTTLPRSQQINYGHGPKAFIEIKMARNVSIFGNTFEGWHNALVLTARNQGSTVTGNAFPWSGLFNINISNNYFKRTLNWNRQFSGVVGGPALEDSEFTTVRSGPVTIANNLFDSGVEEIFLSMTSADNVTLTHNTYPGSPTPLGRASMIFAHTTTSDGFVFKDNILAYNEYGMNCQSGPTGGCWSNLQMARNVIIDNRTDAGKIGDGPLNPRHPNDFIASEQAEVAWSAPATANYRLAANSPFKGRGSGGTDPGVDMDQLLAALGGTLSLPSPTPTPAITPTPTPTPIPSPTPAPSPGQSVETVWVNGALPNGATGYDDTDGWRWIRSNPTPHFAPLVHQSNVIAGTHQHYFANASSTLTLNLGDVLYTYVYLDAANPPSEIMLQWSTTGFEFDHRAYWGANNIAWGISDTESRRYMGTLPAAGQWARLEIPASRVGLEGRTISGMAFTLYGGKASWDRTGKSGASVPTPGDGTTSPASVLRAKDHAASLAGQMGPAFTSLVSHHALVSRPEALSDSQLASDLEALTNDIVLAHEDFLTETNLFGATAAAIETHLSAALLFARANAAVALKTGNTASVSLHLDRIVSHLTMTEDLMLYGSISAMTADHAIASHARIDLVIGGATAGYGQSDTGLLAPSSLGLMFGSIGQSFCVEPVFATSPAEGDGYELGGVSVIVGGRAAQLVYVSPSRLAFVVPADLTLGSAEVIVTSQDGYLSRGVTTIARNVFRIMTSADDGSADAIAMNLTKQTNGFDVVTAENLGPDKRTRLTLLVVGISGSAANSDTSNDVTASGVTVANFAESVVVEARQSNGVVINLPVEFAGSQSAMIGLDQVNVRLIPELRGAGVVTLTLVIAGQSSNAGTIFIR